MSNQVPKEVKTFVRATLISAGSSGIKQTKFPKDYEKYAEAKLEWRKMGFKDLYEFLLAIPDVARLTYSEKDGENLVFGVTNKDVYSSSHAQKAEVKGMLGPKHRPPSEWRKPGKPVNKNSNQKGGKDERKIDVAKDLSSVKVTVGNVQANDEERICPNVQGLYGIHISNLPKACTKDELEKLFKDYLSLKECKIVNKQSQKNSPYAFAKFSSKQDAIMAMQQKNGYLFKGCKLKLNKAKEVKAEETQKQKENQQKSEANTIVSPSATGKQCANTQPGTNKDLPKSGSRLSSRSATSLDRLPSPVSNNTISLKQSGTSVKQASTQNPGIHNSRDHPGQQSHIKQQSQKQLHHHQQQQLEQPQHQQHQQVLQQQQRQSTGHFPSLASSFVPVSIEPSASSLPVPSQSALKSVHLILSKEEMDIMNRACGHPVDYRLNQLPLELEILVTEVVDACHFWAVIDTKTGNWNQLEDVESKIRQLNTRPNVPPKYTIGAGKFSENNVWYRCFVLDVAYDGKYIKVLYTDYGNAEWIPLERFTTLDQQLWSLPPQTNPFHLAGLVLSNNDIENIQEGAAFLKELICFKTFIAKKKPTTNPLQPHIVEVELFDRLQPDKSINSVMSATRFVKPMVNPGSQSKAPTKSTQSSSQVKRTEDFEAKIKISLTWVHSPELLYYSLVSPETEGTLKKMESRLNQIPVTEMIFPRIGQLACLVTMNHGRKRVKILEILRSVDVFHTVIEVKVIYLDYGIVRHVPVTSLLQLPPDLVHIPCQARRACLADVKLPADQITWPPSAITDISMSKAKIFYAKIVDHLPDGMVIIELYNKKGENMNEKIKHFMKEFRGEKTTSLSENKTTAPNENVQAGRGNPSKKESGQEQSSRGSTSSPIKVSIAVTQAQKTPVGTNFDGNQSNAATHSTGNHTHKSQSEKAYYPSSPEYPYNPVTSDKSSVVAPGQNSTIIKTDTYNYYMPPPPSTHAPHSDAVYQGLPLNRPAVANKNTRDISTNERLQSHRNDYVPALPISDSMNTATFGKEERGMSANGQNSVIPKHPDKRPVHQENSPTLTEKERNEKMTKGNESPVATKEGHKTMTELEWLKEKELLLARSQAQQEYIEKLSKRSSVKPSTQNNLQELKLRLENQVRIKELENRALKLRKEVEALEVAKAELQYQLMNS